MASTAQSGTGSSHPFTCNTCQVAFRGSELQRTHMQSDWHRYNLKRRVASLPPLTSEIFAEKVLANKASAAATAARASFEKVCPACSKTYYSENAYQNHLGSQKHKTQVARIGARRAVADDAETGSMMSSTFSLGEPAETASTVSAAEASDIAAVTNGIEATSLAEGGPVRHMGTAHPESAQNEDNDTTMDDLEEPLVEVRLNQCLFCNAPSEDVDNNLSHMSKTHGMFIPERDYLVDLEGLLAHLHGLIYDVHQCLYCKQFKNTATGIQTHMRDRGHCMIAYDTEEDQLEVGDYYDFRSTYSDEDEEDEDEEVEGKSKRRGAGVRLGAARATKVTIETGNGSSDEVIDGDEDGWESDASSLSSVPTDEITSIPIDDHSHRYKSLNQHKHHSHNDPRPHRNFDGYHSRAHPTPRAVYYDEYEMHLPTGRTAGHRSLNKYFRQNLRNRSPSAEKIQRRAIEAAGSDSEDEDMSDGGAPTPCDAAPSNERDRGRQLVARATRELAVAGLTDAKKREVRAVEKKAQKKAQRHEARYKWGNEKRANHQKHFRDPLLQ